LTDFADILGGESTVILNDHLYYVPHGKRVKLSMDQSSSAVRSLLDIGFYLKHEAQIGDLLMVDEPELNLHPENQRRHDLEQCGEGIGGLLCPQCPADKGTY
jgi:predicted ATP-dependent endonuclease of OLD family